MSAVYITTEHRARIEISARSNSSPDYLNRQAEKLRASADGVVRQRKKLIASKGHDSADADTEAEEHVNQEERRENLGG